jgi:hypothetical protein
MVYSLYMHIKHTLQKHGFFKIGETIPNLTLYGTPAPYPVVDDRVVRAGAGIMFALGFFAFFHALYLGNLLYLQIIVAFFFFDFFAKTIIGLRFSPVNQVARLLVRGQTPEYVGAIQKRFAWSIGLVLSGAMLLLLFVFDIQGYINLIICSICLLFMWFESAAGLCVGCKIYAFLLQHKLIKQPEHKPVCPGNVCSVE